METVAAELSHRVPTASSPSNEFFSPLFPTVSPLFSFQQPCVSPPPFPAAAAPVQLSPQPGKVCTGWNDWTRLQTALGGTASISYQLFFFLLPLQFFNLLPALGPLLRSGLHGFRETARGKHSLGVTHRVFKRARSMPRNAQACFVFCTCGGKSQLVHMLMNKYMQVLRRRVELE